MVDPAAPRRGAFITLERHREFTDEGEKRKKKEERERKETICERQISKRISARPDDRRSGTAGGQVAYGRWLPAPSSRTRRVPPGPGETSHSYKTDGLVAPRVSPGSRLA